MDQKPIRFAGFRVRFLAVILDGLALVAISTFSYFALTVLKNLTLVFIINLLLVLYKPFLEFKFGATLGKMSLDIRVVDLDLNKISFRQSLLRSLPLILLSAYSVYFPIAIMSDPMYGEAMNSNEMLRMQEEVTSSAYNTIMLIFYLGSVIVIPFDSRKRALHDRIAGTYCIRE